MEFALDLKNKVDEFITEEYDDGGKFIDYIPTKDAVSIKKKVKKLELCSFCIDMRNSTKILEESHIQDVIKIHKSFLGITTKVVIEYGGKIRDYQGDCLLAFWPANSSDDLKKALKAAMAMKWILDDELSFLFEKFTKLDFGIGIHWSEVFILRAGISRDSNNNDLIFIGESVNLAVALADFAKGPNHIAISNEVYINLEDKWKNKRFLFLIEYGIWEKETIRWQGKRRKIMLTNEGYKID